MANNQTVELFRVVGNGGVMHEKLVVPLNKPLDITRSSLQRLHRHFWADHPDVHHLNSEVNPDGTLVSDTAQEKFLTWLAVTMNQFASLESPPFNFDRKVSADTRRDLMGLSKPVKNGMPPMHPGLILKEMFLDEMKMPVCMFAKHIGVSPVFVHNLLDGTRDVDVRMAFRLSRALGTTVEFWLNLQNSFNIRTLEVSNPGFADHISLITKESPNA